MLFIFRTRFGRRSLPLLASALTRFVVAVLLVIAMAGRIVVADSGRIDRIEFVGNETTVPSTLLQELDFAAGSVIDESQIAAGTQAIMDLGLFKSVTHELREVSGERVLTFVVDEKHFWFVLPRLSRSGDGDISYGANLRFHNLNGRNQTLIFGAKQTNLSNSTLQEEEEVRLRFNNPRLFGSRFVLSTDIRFEQGEIEEERGVLTGEYERKLSSLRFGISRWLSPGRASRGWRAGADVLMRRFDHEYNEGEEGLFFDADLLSFVTQIEYVDVHDRLFSRSGSHFGYELHVASEDLGSDASFTRNSVFYRKFVPIGARKHQNLNFQLRFGVANRTVFGQSAYDLGGANTLRGYERESIKGNTYLLANVEYLRPLFGRDAWRGVLFADIGNAYEDVDSIEFDDLKVSAGVGLRWRIKSLVDTEIRVDYGRGLDDGISKVYASTKATF